VKILGQRNFCSLQGVRKIGKTSVIHEVRRRYEHDPEICVALIDCYDRCDDPDRFFLYYAAQVINEFLRKKGYAEQTGVFPDPKQRPAFDEAFPKVAAQVRSLGLKELNLGVLAMEWLQEPPPSQGDPRRPYGGVTALAEDLAQASGLYFQLIFDEFQETAKLRDHPLVQRTLGDLFKTWRSQWIMQQHRVNYMVTGSRLAQLRYLLFHPREAFFGHFSVRGLQGLPCPEAQKMVETLLAEAGYRFADVELLKRLIDLTRGQPFALRETLDAMCDWAGPRRVLGEEALQRGVTLAFFGEYSKLNMHYQEVWRDFMDTCPAGRDVLIALSEGLRTAPEIAASLHLPEPDVRERLEQLEMFYFIRNVNVNRYIASDPVFEFWVCGAKSRYQNVAGPYLVGRETERQLALYLREHGLDLVYQSFASRGAFDLLMGYNYIFHGIQVKKVREFRCFFPEAEYRAMVDFVERYHLKRGLIALYDGTAFRLYDLSDLHATPTGHSINRQTPYATNPLELL
jgi:Holliday junction resolvase